MTREEIEALMRREIETSCNKRDVGVFHETSHPERVSHIAMSRNLAGAEGMGAAWQGVLDAFPDLHVRIDELFVDGMRGGARVTYTGTHNGPLLGLAPTGRRVEFTALGLAHMREGKVSHLWIELDFLGLMQQLGVHLSSPAHA